MESLALLKLLDKIPPATSTSDAIPSTEATRKHVDSADFELALVSGWTLALGRMVEERNVPDRLQEAYGLLHPDSGKSLLEHYSEILERGEGATRGFLSNLKGKLAELEAPDILSERYFPGYKFHLSENLQQPVWDLAGVGPEGHEVLVQVKMGAASYASEVAERMSANSDVPFLVSSDLYETLISRHPELMQQLFDMGEDSQSFTSETANMLQQLLDNHGIDIPDDISDILPYIGDILLGLKLLHQIISTHGQVEGIPINQELRLHALKTIGIISRFGIGALLSTILGSAGTMIAPGIGSVVGIAVGLLASWQAKKALMPQLDSIALQLLDLDTETVYYLEHHREIEQIGAALHAEANQLCSTPCAPLPRPRAVAV